MSFRGVLKSRAGRLLVVLTALTIVLAAVAIGVVVSVESEGASPAPPAGIPVAYTVEVGGRTFGRFGTSLPERLGATLPVRLTVSVPEGFRLECLVLAPFPNLNGTGEHNWNHCPNIDRLTRPLLSLDQGLRAGSYSYDLSYRVEYSYEYDGGQSRKLTTADPTLQLMWQATVTNPAEAGQYASGSYFSLPVVTIPVVPAPVGTI